VSPSPVPTQSPTPVPAKTGTVTITMPTVVSAYNGNLQVQLLNSKDSNAVVATYTVKQGASVTSGSLPISDSTHAYKVKLVSGIADPLNGVNYIESGTPTVAVKNGQNTAMSIPMKASTTTKRTVTLAISGLQGSDKATIGFADANGKYSYVGYSGYGNGNAVFKIENNQNLTITVATAGGSYQSSSLSNSSTISKNQTIAMTFAAKVQPSPSPVPTVAPSPSPVPSPSPSVVPSPTPSPSGVQCSGYETWSSSTAYTGGAMVSYNGYVYKANWWTQGNNPASNNGGPGSGEEWLKIQACQ